MQSGMGYVCRVGWGCGVSGRESRSVLESGRAKWVSGG